MQINDFIRISYSGKIRDMSEEFDKGDAVPVIVGAKYVINGLDEALQQMNLSEKRTVEIQPEKGFGQRDLNLIKLVPESEFRKHNTRPYPGMVVNADNLRGRVLSVSSGRVKVDFNHPLAGKNLIYEVEIKEKIEKLEEKISAIVEFYTRLEKDKIKVTLGGENAEIIIPPVVHSVYKKKISEDIMRFVPVKSVKFSEVFEKTE